MEQARYWMWTKRRHGLSSHHLQAAAAYDDSWEEQAFAEDAAGPLGGCIWPPRSYSCSFCRREFRSAQALGGHMNVHRRDRARLKQSPTDAHNEGPHHDQKSHHQNHIQNPFPSLDAFPYPSHQVSNLACNPNPNSDHRASNLPSPSSPSRISAAATKENCSPDRQTLVLPFSSPIVKEPHNKKSSPTSSPKSWSNLVADRFYQFTDLMRTDHQEEKNPRILESGCRVKADYVQTDLSVSLNLFVRRTCPTAPGGGKEETVVGCKRRRTETQSPLPFFLKPISIDRHHVHQSEVLELSPSSMEELDLELRLGDGPKVK